MAEQSYNLKYTGKEIDDLLDKANDMNSSAQVPTGGSSGQVLTKKSSANFDAEWKTPGTTLPSGGTAGQVLTKNSSTAGDASWKTPEAPSNPLPTGGAAGQALVKNSSTNYDVKWADIQSGGDGSIYVISGAVDGSAFVFFTGDFNDVVGAADAGKFIVVIDDSKIPYYMTDYTSASARFMSLPRVGTTGNKTQGIITWGSSDGSTGSYTSASYATLPSGGTSGQALVKSSATDFSVTWADVSGGGTTAESNVYVVAMNSSSKKTDKTYSEMLAASTAGKVIIILDSNKDVYVMYSQGSTSCTFIQWPNISAGSSINSISQSRLTWSSSNENGPITKSSSSRGLIPLGGTTGQVLTKNSDSASSTDYTWTTPSSSGGGSGITKTQLWKASNTSISTQAAQTITLSSGLSNYKYIYAIYVDTGGSIASSSTVLQTDIHIMGAYSWSLKGADGGHRSLIYSSDTTLSLYAGYDSSGSQNNAKCILLGIYGLN